MELVVNFFKSRLVDVRVDLSGRDAGVAKHFLDLAQVGAAGEQMSGKAMP